MNRRRFIQGLAGLPLVLDGSPAAWALQQLEALVGGRSNGRVLVLVELRGGLDGLSTVVPTGDAYNELVTLRGSLLPAVGELLPLNDMYGWHPALEGFQRLYDAGALSVLQGVGYPNVVRSHKRGSEIYATAASATETRQSGWLTQASLTASPSSSSPGAVVLDGTPAQATQTPTGFDGVALLDPSTHTPIPIGPGGDAVGRQRFAEELDFLQHTISDSNQFGASVAAAANQGDSSVDYPDEPFAAQLRSVARLISGGLESSVYLTHLDGFDTHAAQHEAGHPSEGKLPQLLEQLGGALLAFQRDLELLQLQERVITLVYTPFGRQVSANASGGTDHGAGAPAFLIGSCVAGGMLGDLPDFSALSDPTAGVPVEVDYRNLYGTILEDWFEVPSSEIRAQLYQEYERLTMLGACDAIVPTIGAATLDAELRCAPNPFTKHTTLSISLARALDIQVSVFDAHGRMVEEVFRGGLSAKQHSFHIDTSRYPAGVYTFRLVAGREAVSTRAVRS